LSFGEVSDQLGERKNGGGGVCSRESANNEFILTTPGQIERKKKGGKAFSLLQGRGRSRFREYGGKNPIPPCRICRGLSPSPISKGEQGQL